VPALAAAAAAAPAYKTPAAAATQQHRPRYLTQVLAVAALLLVVLVLAAHSRCLTSHPPCCPLVLAVVGLSCSAGLVQCLAVKPQTRCHLAASLGLLLQLAVGVQALLVLVVARLVAPPCHH
jgi:hypothetical protein